MMILCTHATGKIEVFFLQLSNIELVRNHIKVTQRRPFPSKLNLRRSFDQAPSAQNLNKQNHSFAIVSGLPEAFDVLELPKEPIPLGHTMYPPPQQNSCPPLLKSESFL
jgi:hypothetical protein